MISRDHPPALAAADPLPLEAKNPARSRLRRDFDVGGPTHRKNQDSAPLDKTKPGDANLAVHIEPAPLESGVARRGHSEDKIPRPASSAAGSPLGRNTDLLAVLDSGGDDRPDGRLFEHLARPAADAAPALHFTAAIRAKEGALDPDAHLATGGGFNKIQPDVVIKIAPRRGSSPGRWESPSTAPDLSAS